MATRPNPVWIFIFEYDGCSKTFPACGAPTPCSNAYDMPGTYHTCSDRCLYECGIQRQILSNCRIPYHIQQELGEYQYGLAVTGTPSQVPTRFMYGQTYSRPGTFSFEFSGVKYCNDPLNSSPLSRLVSAQKNWKGRRLTTYFGHENLRLCEFEKSVFVIDDIAGPSGSADTFKVTAKSPLESLSGKKCPSGSQLRDIDGDFVDLVLGPALDGFPDDSDTNANPYFSIGGWLLDKGLSTAAIDYRQAQEISQSSAVIINGEALQVLPSIGPDGGYNFKLVDRGFCGSTIKPHESGSTFELAQVFQPHDHVADVFRKLLTQCAELPSVFLLCCDDEDPIALDFQSFTDYKCQFPEQVLGDWIVISKSTSITTLLKELAQTFLTGLFDDGGILALDGVRPRDPNATVVTINDYHVAQNSERIKPNTDSYAAVQYQHTPADCTEGISEDNLLDSTSYTREELFLQPCERHEQPDASIFEIKTRFITRENQHLAYANSVRWCRLLACASREMCLDVDIDIASQFSASDSVTLRIDKYRDHTGEYDTREWIVLSKRMVSGGSCVQLCLLESPFENIEPCFSCDFQLTSVYDPTDPTDPVVCNNTGSQIW